MSVLVVDDHLEVAEFVAEALREMENLEVDIASSQDAAEAMFRRKPYELCIVDLYLKGLDEEPDGLYFVKWARKKNPKVRVILMTGKSYSKVITDVVVRTGETHLLSKPIDLNVLLETVRTVMADPEDG
jgi:DNA-binding response OmpR family regulator